MNDRGSQLLLAALIASLSLLSPVSAGAPARGDCGTMAFPAAPAAHLGMPDSQDADVPSKLDYLVLASFADSRNLLALSAYRAPSPVTEAAAAGSVNAVD